MSFLLPRTPALLLLVALTIAPETASASQCSSVTVQIDDVSVSITPDPGCLEATVETRGCSDQSAVVLRSTCEDTVTLPEGLQCDSETTCSGAFEATGYLNAKSYEDGDKSVTYDLWFHGNPPPVPEGAVQVHITWHEEYGETEGESMDGGCSTSGGEPGAGGLLSLLALLWCAGRRQR
jgi:hypothetical protein